MNQNHLTIKSQEALQKAQVFAEDRGHPELTVEHLLSALIEDGEGLASRLLNHMEVSVTSVRQKLSEALGRLPETRGDTQLRPGDELGRVLDSAAKEARRLKDEYISIEHLLLGRVLPIPESRRVGLPRPGVHSETDRTRLPQADTSSESSHRSTCDRDR